MTLVAKFLPWFIVKHFVHQIAASQSFAVGGEHLSGIRVDDTFFIIPFPARGLRKFLLFLAYLLPAGLVVRHHSHLDFTIEYGSARYNDLRTLPVSQIDPSSALIAFFTPTQAKQRALETKERRAGYKVANVAEKAAKAAERERWAAEAREHEDVQRAAAERAAQALRASR